MKQAFDEAPHYKSDVQPNAPRRPLIPMSHLTSSKNSF